MAANDGGSQDGINRRVYERKRVSVTVGMRTEHGFWNGFAENISEGGIFIATHAPFDMGEEVELTFVLAKGKKGERKKYSVVCEVCWIRPDSGGGLPPGMGLKFKGLPDSATREIQDYIDKGALDVLFMDVDD